ADRAPSSSDILVTWDAEPGATYHLRNISVTTGATLAIVDVTGGSWTFTAAAQNAAYGSLAGYAYVNVAQLVGGIQGPAAVLVQEIGAGGGLPAPTGIAAHHSGSDLVVTWDDVEGASWSVLNRDITNNAVLTTVTVTDPTWTFTSDAMTAVYGFPTSGLYVEVTRVGGGMASYTGTVP
ncbi:hypothetical protein V5F77_25565, partial [Xanthobacter sp. DSM 24535]|uniref:hypothetical protein n=1 Tax=Roseixanthobacter psychrophilus TaxID=3119917 RepID=UPI003728084D